MKKNLLYFLFALTLLASCSPYQKALKTEDIGEKFSMGTTLYDAGKYRKASRLFEQLVPLYRGRPQAEKLMYMYAYTFYYNKEYYNANYQMERFVESYPESEKAEEMAFLAAKSYYHLAPNYSRDQTDTNLALEKLQAFINQYPETTFLAEANQCIKELDYKLERKAFEIAVLYYNVNDYEACIKSFDNFILDFPGTTFRKQAFFIRLQAAYNLALKSVVWKQQARAEAALSYFSTFERAYSNSEDYPEAQRMAEELKELIKTLQAKS
ncbi:MAG: outer membrane protein assembly factor BamD [Bacteroidetes bacterium]|jgi:outer membrane protein assembly factor BamD|nr:outer membrane protein assembly factor BamD [Bacteroidota bacterium]MDA0878790.1 outer membrane protein assembly factor BamD [Bacteroidota bacterium]MDA1115222.1 outer membrane protein assembly factor BamD [Bacteroidota bacterium]